MTKKSERLQNSEMMRHLPSWVGGRHGQRLAGFIRGMIQQTVLESRDQGVVGTRMIFVRLPGQDVLGHDKNDTKHQVNLGVLRNCVSSSYGYLFARRQNLGGTGQL